MYKTPERKAFDKELGAILKRARIAAGLTRNDVSIDTSLNPSSIDRIERGESSTNTFDVLRIIAAIGCELDRTLRKASEAAHERLITGKNWKK